MPTHPDTRETRDIDLLRRAIVERWPMPPGKRQEIIDRLMLAIYNPKDKIAIAAARALIAADNVNLREYQLLLESQSGEPDGLIIDAKDGPAPNERVARLETELLAELAESEADGQGNASGPAPVSDGQAVCVPETPTAA